ncbi:MAG: hemolysin family protein [Spirochaetia bacterium]|nr:hemolysin family protein [Spirochaetia bacterium]
MSTMTQVMLFSLTALFVLAALLSVAETAIVGMSRIKIVAHIKNNHPKAKYLKVWMSDPNKLLATFSICINTVAIASSTIGAFLSIDISRAIGIDEGLTATVVAAIITVIIIIFGEISPKIFAIHNTEKLGLLLIGPVVFVYKMIRPITELFVKISNVMIKLFGGQASTSIPVVTAKDITTVINVSAEAGYIDEQEKAMMDRILNFNEMTVKQAMVPRTSITAIDIEWAEDKILDIVMESGYSRMPVYKGSLDNIVGILYIKDMLSMIKNRGLIIFHDIIRIPFYVPETKAVGDLLREFQKGRLHMAIIVDEFGGTSGLITMEDVLEEIVGEIHDEYDMDEKDVEDLGNNSFVVKGMMELSKLNAPPFKLDIPVDEDVNTVGGFVTALFGYLPKPGESIRYGGTVFTVMKADERKISRIRIDGEAKPQPLPPAQSNG